MEAKIIKKADFYPASGYRAYGSGILDRVGLTGCAWSGSSYSASGMNGSGLVFSSSDLNPEVGYGSRAHGFPVRCVHE